jgi:hypothetical protein
MAAALDLAAPGEAAEGEDPVAAGDLPGAIWRIRQELATGGYLQARRRLDGLLQAIDPLGLLPGGKAAHAETGTLGLLLWTAAEIYLQSAPTPARVELPGDLGA